MAHWCSDCHGHTSGNSPCAPEPPDYESQYEYHSQGALDSEGEPYECDKCSVNTGKEPIFQHPSPGPHGAFLCYDHLYEYLTEDRY